jgi:hypothetical protein
MFRFIVDEGRKQLASQRIQQRCHLGHRLSRTRTKTLESSHVPGTRFGLDLIAVRPKWRLRVAQIRGHSKQIRATKTHLRKEKIKILLFPWQAWLMLKIMVNINKTPPNL